MAPKYLLAPLAVLTVVMPTPASATSIFDLSIDTTPSSGALAALAFDLVSGNPAPNSVTIENFITDGILGVPSSTNGPVTGLLPAPVTIADGAVFNELLQPITLATNVSFRLQLTNAFAGGIPDQFSLFLLDATTLLPLFPTSDPTGADALFVVDITGEPFGRFQTFTATGAGGATVSAVPIPEPASAWLLCSGLAALLANRRRQGRRGCARGGHGLH